ncbi:ankyrin repeat domain-containing protein [Alkalicella caledoniensis]|uniref:Ankyrin repeat domain-containing protein n=1 Tax=Alkalicella caledoniensis TaxID=2731377 RepID=A0A7G9W6L0_ALKCA|nr:ankyrin repeat domain-containing protein [Alkalicella caledoniensis]QNO14322.1 ankyrin repeat domain-containing protein [Alkalicella caledoniensis]
MNLNENNENYRIKNVEIFKDTPAWDLALAVEKEDANSIEEILKTNPELINFHDDNYGITPLLWAVGVRKYKSGEALLKCGADPNIPAKGELGTPLLVAVMKPWDDKYVDNTNIIELLLKYKADPNKGYIGEDTLMMESGTSSLHRAVYMGIEKTKVLVEGGADINIKTKSGRTPAINALIDGSFYKKEAKSAVVAHYLIVEKKANVSEPYFSRAKNINESERKENYTIDLLRDWVSDLDSEEYILKMEVVKEFLRQGVNYWHTEVTDKRLKSIMKLYPNDWQEFIKLY